MIRNYSMKILNTNWNILLQFFNFDINLWRRAFSSAKNLNSQLLPSSYSSFTQNMLDFYSRELANMGPHSKYPRFDLTLSFYIFLNPDKHTPSGNTLNTGIDFTQVCLHVPFCEQCSWEIIKQILINNKNMELSYQYLKTIKYPSKTDF